MYNVAINGKGIKESQILKEFEKAEGKPLHAQLDIDSPLPWDKYLEYKRDKLETLAKKHRSE